MTTISGNLFFGRARSNAALGLQCLLRQMADELLTNAPRGEHSQKY